MPGWAPRACSKRRARRPRLRRLELYERTRASAARCTPSAATASSSRAAPTRPSSRSPGRSRLARERRHRRPLARLQRGHPQELRLPARAPARAARGHHPHGPDAHGAVRAERPDELAGQAAHGPRPGAAARRRRARRRRPDESLGDFVRRRLGKEALARIAEPIVAGIHAGDPEQMSVRATFPMFLDMEREHRSLILGMIRRRQARARAAAAAARTGPLRPRPTAADARRPALLLLLLQGRAAGPERRHRRRRCRPSACTGVGRRRHDVRAGRSAGLGAGSDAPAERGDGRPRGDDRPRYRLRLRTAPQARRRRRAGDAGLGGDLLRPVAPLAAADLSSIEYVTHGHGVGRLPATRWGTTSRASASSCRAPRTGRVMADHLELEQVRRARARRPRAAAQLPRARRPRGRGPAGRRRDGADWSAPSCASIMGITAEPEFVQIFRWPRGMPQYRVGHVGWSQHRGRRRGACRASSSPAAPTTASASATACARARPRRARPRLCARRGRIVRRPKGRDPLRPNNTMECAHAGRRACLDSTVRVDRSIRSKEGL